MNIHTKTIFQGDDDIQKKMYELVYKYRIETGCEPIGFIMGSNTYLDLVIYLRNHMSFLYPIYPTEWCGLPIRIIRRPQFLELEIPHESASRFAMGTVRQDEA